MSPPSPIVRIGPVPGYPYVRNENLDSFLETQLLTSGLDELGSWLRLVGTPKGSHISTLHEQIVFDRKIVRTEEARLHMLWHRDTIFLKPIPTYLLPRGTSACVQERAPPGSHLRKAINGFLRSYVYLIQGPLDLEVAIREKLIPSEYKDDIESLFEFLSRYQHISDGPEVSPRYCYGELRLTRINFYNRLARHELYYQKIHKFYNAYFGRFAEPFLFAFGTASVVLSAFQVILATFSAEDQTTLYRKTTWVARWSSFGSILFVLASIAIFIFLFLFLMLREARYALMKYLKARWKNKGKAEAV